MANNYDDPLNDFEQAELQRRFPHAGYWFGMLPAHPQIHHPGLNDIRNHLYHPIPGPPPLHLPPMYQPPIGPAAAIPPLMYPPPPGPPPGYYRHPPAPTAPPRPPHLLAHEVNVAQISVSIPLNTAVVGGVVTRVTLRLPTDLSFQDFFSRVCARMDLDPLEALLGYKYPGDLARQPPYRLTTNEELREAMAKRIEKIKRARTREVFMEIHNLRPAQRAAAASTLGRKGRNSTSQPLNSEEPDTTLTFIKELRELKRRLECQLHKGRYCFVSPINGQHQGCDIYQLTFWAKKIFLGQANYQSPPSSLEFDHVPKRIRRVKPAISSQPEIHVHIPSNIIASSSSRLDQRFSLVNSHRSNPTNFMPSLDLIDLTACDNEPTSAIAECEGKRRKVKVEDKENNWKL
ncbi:hypothetical protein K443DRAFT_10688 [Laccaria amethystina LaAM-08-1]|uniref:Uncharacterized protein n=1 Tax=Laccaria amethystina LaAM-08-1 TaxID=1095629 RepID=A0A0C9WV85_9AGAR|nr:hypothetical protein K443DRAFT_10688 [Laccaria amethystina LaAM-08-1]